MNTAVQNEIESLIPEKKLYRLAVFTVIGLICCNQLLIQYILYQQKNDARTISMAEGQRLLCHQIVDRLTSEGRAPINDEEFRKKTEQWNLVHHALQQGSSTLGVDRLDGDEVLLLFKEANPYQFKIYDQATGKYSIGNIEELENSASIFSDAMGKVVDKCEAHSRSKLTATIIVEVVLAFVTLLVLLLEIKYIFRPAFSKINRQSQLLKLENKNLKETQDLLQAVQDSSSLAIIVLDRGFNIISLNKKAIRNFRFVQNQNIEVGIPILTYLPNHIRSNFSDHLNQVLSGKSSTAEYCIVNANNKTRWYEIEFHPMKEDGQHITGVAFSVKDITRNKEYEIDLEQQNERLKKIAYVQAHDLRGPITSMLGLVDLITEENKFNGKAKNHIDQEYVVHFKKLSKKVDKIIHEIVLESDARRIVQNGKDHNNRC